MVTTIIVLITSNINHQALTGFSITVPHLDGRKWVVRSKQGEVLQPQRGGPAIKAVKGGGMPIHQDLLYYAITILFYTILYYTILYYTIL